MNDKNILVISPNKEKFPCPVIPTGALQIYNMLNKTGHNVKFIDLCFIEDSSKYLVDILIKYTPSIIVFSIRNIDNETLNNSVFYLKEIKDYIKLCDKYCKSKIILGGVGFSLMHMEIYKYLEADYGIVGHGTASLLDLIGLIKLNKETPLFLSEILGLVYKIENKVVETNRSPNIDLICKTDWHGIYNNCDKKYLTFIKEAPHPPLFGLRTNIGCLYNCIHCKIPSLEGKMQYSPIEETIDALRIIENKVPSKKVFMVDNIFNADYQKTVELCKAIIKEGINVKWTCYLHPKEVDKQLINLMKDAGCDNVSIGIDTASSKLVEIWKKGFTIDELKVTAEACKKIGLPVFYSLIFGGWKETKETLQESLLTLKEIQARMVWGAWGVRVYPGTQLAKILINNKYIDENESLLEPFFYVSSEIEKDGITQIKAFKENNPGMLIKLNTGNVI